MILAHHLALFVRILRDCRGWQVRGSAASVGSHDLVRSEVDTAAGGKGGAAAFHFSSLVIHGTASDSHSGICGGSFRGRSRYVRHAV